MEGFVRQRPHLILKKFLRLRYSNTDFTGFETHLKINPCLLNPSTVYSFESVAEDVFEHTSLHPLLSK